MARRRKAEVDAEEIHEDMALTPGGETVEVKMKGPAESVLKRLEQKKAEPEKEEAPEVGTEFTRALASPKNTVIVRRITPRNWGEAKINVEVWRENCPLTMQDIHEELAQNHGGRKYRVSVVDTETGTIVTAQKLEIEADPIVEMGEEEELRSQILKANEPTMAEMSEQAIERRARIAAKQLEFEQIQEQLDTVKSRKPNGKLDEAANAKLLELEKKLEEARHQAKVESIEREYQTKFDSLQKEIEAVKAQKAEPKKDNSEITLILQQMREDQKANREQFNALLNKIQDDKMNMMLEELRAIKNRPQRESSSMTEAVETFRNIAELLGMDLPGGKGGDDDNEPKEWWERMMDKYVPRIFDMFEDRKEKGGPAPTKEELLAEIQKASKLAEEDAVRNAKMRILADQRQAMTPQRPSPVAAGPAPVTPPAVAAAVETVTPSTPAPIPAAPQLQLVPPPPPALPKTPTVEEEIALRVAGVLELISREIEIRPRHWQWTYEGAWQSLNEDLLEKVSTAPDPQAMLDVFAQVPTINAVGIQELKEKVASNVRVTAFLQRGLSELKSWWEKSSADPDFDPADEEEELVGEEN